MKNQILTIEKNDPVTESIFHLRLQGDCSAMHTPGQFAALSVPGFFLRRPFSVCDWDAQGMDLYYKLVGGGTEALAAFPVNTPLDTLVGLGNGYDCSCSGDKPLLMGGGMGVTPLLSLCRRLLAEGKQPTVLLGFASVRDVILFQDFEALGVPVFLCTEDGSAGHKGRVTDLMEKLDYTYFYTCGPEPMFRAIDRLAHTGGQFSFEARMGCGIGACMGCTCKTHKGNKRICKDGPVLERSEILW